MIETLLRPSEIPDSFKKFDRWMERYIRERPELMDGISQEEYLRDHHATFVAQALEYGLKLSADGTLVEIRKPS